MYLVIAKKFSNLKRGGHTISKRFCSLFPNDLEYRETAHARNLEELDEEYQRLIFRTQVLRCYTPPLNILKLMKLNHVAYIRDEHNFSTLNSCTNGFYYYKYTTIKHYVPMITDFPHEAKMPNKSCIGFYSRKWLTPDSYKWFISKLDEWPDVDVCILGSPSEKIEQKTKGKFKHTFDNVEFFNSITHYVMPKSVSFIDPFPHTLLEAVQTGKQIIIPTIGHRNHKDGIDDIQDCISWHDDFYPDKTLDNSSCLLRFKNFKKFYQDVIKNNFEYSFDKRKYKNIVEWLLGEIL